MPIKAQLFITCLAEQFYPNVLEKMVGLLERLGVESDFPAAQTCCGQPVLAENLLPGKIQVPRFEMRGFDSDHEDGLGFQPNSGAIPTALVNWIIVIVRNSAFTIG